jgi:uncharacterized repeat protein (TIGR02543 family)
MMKNRNIVVLVLVFVVLVSSLQVIRISAQQDEGNLIASADREVSTPSFGVEINQYLHPTTFGDSLSKADTAGTHWLRYNGIKWSDVQPDNNTDFIWSNVAVHELNIEAASDAGMEVILVISGTPSWAQKYPGYTCGPMTEATIPAFANFMAELVSRYSASPYNVKYFELWNEPDEFRESVNPAHQVFGCWGEPTDTTYYGGRHYGQMLKAVYPAVKQAVPEAQIVMGGLLLPCPPGADPYCNMSNFFKGVIEEEKLAGQNIFDYANFHGYTTYNPEGNPIPGQTQGYTTGILMEKNESWWAGTAGMVEGKLLYIKEVMGSNQKPIFMTEAALVDQYERSGSNVTLFEARKADYLVWVYTRNIARGIDATTWYHLDNYGWNQSGLLDSTNTALPAYTAFKFLTTALDGAVYQKDLLSEDLLSLDDGILGFEFSKDVDIWVLFSEDGVEKSITVPDRFVGAYDLFGDPVVPDAGSITFTRPIYVEISGIHTISGTVREGIAGLPGVTMTYDVDKTVTTGAEGTYTITVDRGWSGTVTPSKEEYSFEPPSRSYTAVDANQVEQDFTATLNMYTVTFNANGGTGTMDPQSGEYNTTAALTQNTFIRTGYTFSGWNTAANGTGESYVDQAPYTFLANETLYAQWTANTYTVTFNANGGSRHPRRRGR